MKALYCDRNGFCLWQKRLERGRFCIPSILHSHWEVSFQELQILLCGVDIRTLSSPLRIEDQFQKIETQNQQISSQAQQIETQSQQISEQTQKIEAQPKKIEEQSQRIDQLTDQINSLKCYRFGKKSEKVKKEKTTPDNQQENQDTSRTLT